MRLDTTALTRNDPAALAELMRTCSSCARIGASKVGAGSFADDITQELMLLVLGPFLQRYDAERDIEPFLKEAARRMGLSYLRKHTREVLSQAWGEDWDPIEAAEDESAHVERQLAEDEVDQQARSARDILIARMRAKQQARAADSTVADLPPAAPAESSCADVKREADPQLPDDEATRIRAIRTDRANRPEVLELAAVRRRIGLTQSEMARALGLLENSIRSIEYGVVAGDPKTLLKSARKLEKQHKSIDADMTGAALIKRWCAELGLREDDTVELASMLGLHRSTLYRWSAAATQPPPHKVRQLNAVVEALKDGVR